MMKTDCKRTGWIAALALVLLAPALGAQEGGDDLREEIEALKRGQQEMQRELAEIKKLLRQQARAPQPAARPAGPQVEGKVFDLGDNPVKGDAAAALTLVEFTDYQCGFCNRHFQNTWPQIQSEYVDTGKIRYAALDLPLESIHPLAFKAAEASHCAGDQEKFWEMHDRLFAHQKSLTPWEGHAEALGLDVAAFTACLESGKYAESVRRDMAEASKAGASGTPSFVLAKTDPENPSKVEGLAFIRGAQPFNAFKSAIDRALAGSAGD